jgi:hypothetical protein
MLIPPSLVPRIKVMQIIAAALMMGLAVFVVIANFITANNPPPPPGQVPVVTYLGLFMLASLIPVGLILPVLATRGPLENVIRTAAAAPATADTAEEAPFWGQLLAIRQTALILALAPLEGAGFFNVVAFIIDRSPLALGAALGALVVMAMRFPTFASVAAWLHQQTEAIAERRQRGAG